MRTCIMDDVVLINAMYGVQLKQCMNFFANHDPDMPGIGLQPKKVLLHAVRTVHASSENNCRVFRKNSQTHSAKLCARALR